MMWSSWLKMYVRVYKVLSEHRILFRCIARSGNSSRQRGINENKKKNLWQWSIQCGMQRGSWELQPNIVPTRKGKWWLWRWEDGTSRIRRLLYEASNYVRWLSASPYDDFSLCGCTIWSTHAQALSVLKFLQDILMMIWWFLIMLMYNLEYTCRSIICPEVLARYLDEWKPEKPERCILGIW